MSSATSEQIKDEALKVTIEALEIVRDLFKGLAEDARKYTAELDRIEEKYFGERR